MCDYVTGPHVDGGEWFLLLWLLFLLGGLLLLFLEASQLVLDPPLLPPHVLPRLLVLISKLSADLFTSCGHCKTGQTRRLT